MARRALGARLELATVSPAILGAIAAGQAARIAYRYGERRGKHPGRVAAQLFVGVLLLGAGAHVIAVVPLAAPLVALGLVVFAAPWQFTRLVLIPLGMPRLAYWTTRLANLTFALDLPGGAAAAAAWALCRQRPRDEETIEWLAAKLAALAPLRAGGVLASGLLLAARGDLEGARTLVGAVAHVDDRASPPVVRRLAASWLAADAAERGDWASVAEHDAGFDGGRLTWLLGGIAHAILLDHAAPSAANLWLRWALAPHRRATWPLVQRASEALRGAFLEPAPDPQAPIAPAAPVGGPDMIRTALSLHAAVLARPPDAIRAEDVLAAGQAWDVALADRGTERAVLERALAIDAGNGAGVLARMRSAVEDDLASIVVSAGLSLAQLTSNGQVTARVRARIRERLLSEVEAASDALRRRVDDRRTLPAPDEWREWRNLTGTYTRAVKSGGEELRRLAFAKLYPDASALAVWLYNERDQRPLGNAIFRWLLAEATALDDARAIALMTKNVGCGV
jgi:hypothetical protein